jgi:para-aminobenzoate synthetase component I
MRPLIQEIPTAHTPESLVEQLHGADGIVLLRSNAFDSASARYSFVTANPFLRFQSFGSRCEIRMLEIGNRKSEIENVFGNPWQILDALMARCELLDEIDSPFPLGGVFGYWGYDLKNFTEPKLPRRAENDLELPDCHVGFYDSVAVFDHQLGKVSVVSTGLAADGSRCESRAGERLEFWKHKLSGRIDPTLTPALSLSERERENLLPPPANPQASEFDGQPQPFPPRPRHGGEGRGEGAVGSNISRAEFVSAVGRAQRYIRSGDIYQVNLSHRLTAVCDSAWPFFQKLAAVSPAPFTAFLDCDSFQICSSSPEQFLRMSGAHIVTRPIKGTRPRAADATRDAQLAYELQTCAKELAELVMITDLLRNDLGKICEFGSVLTPEIAKLEKFAQVQHLVSTVEGRLRKEVTHFAALASAFPGGSITGAPKFRAMEIIDELETVSRGPYCGCLGYLGFNRESQLNIAIRTAVCAGGKIHFNVGAGIVADSNPEAEYEETLAKARGFLAALDLNHQPRMDTDKHGWPEKPSQRLPK